MNNTIEFVVKMRNMMSGELGRLSSTAQSSFNRMNTASQSVQNRNQLLGLSFNELQKRIQETENVIRNSTIPEQISRARRELEMLQRTSAKHSGNLGGSNDSSPGIGIGGIAVGSMIGGLATQGATMLMGAVSSGIGEMVSKSMEKEQAITGLTTFLGKQGATDAYKNIRADANATPYDTASLLEVNRSLISAGANAKDARRDTMNLANAVSAVGGGNDVLTRMAANMQQIKTVGKATSMDIRQFGIAGINIYEMLARSTGKNINQVKEMDVTYEDLAKSLAMANSKGGIYDGAMAAQSQTMSGKWSTVKDNFGTAASDLGDAFAPVINKLLDLGIRFANSIGPAIAAAQPYIDMAANTVSKIVDYIMNIANGTSEWSGWISIIKDYAFSVFEVTSGIAMKLWSIISSMIDFIKKSELLKDIFRFVGWLFSEIGHAIMIIIDQIQWVWEHVLKPILEAIDTAYKWIKGSNDVKITTTKKVLAPKKADDKSVFDSTQKLVTENGAAGKAAGDTVTGGGPKTINITVGKFFDNLEFTTLNTGESVQQIENLVMECLSRVVYNGSKMI